MFKFWRFHQNNSGGQWQDNMPIEFMVEAENAEEANAKAEALGAYFDGVEKEIDCECCGDRWTRAYSSED